nr:MAG TPA: hypothetical protein [Caudoviricetes sp.]
MLPTRSIINPHTNKSRYNIITYYARLLQS